MRRIALSAMASSMFRIAAVPVTALLFLTLPAMASPQAPPLQPAVTEPEPAQQQGPPRQEPAAYTTATVAGRVLHADGTPAAAWVALAGRGSRLRYDSTSPARGLAAREIAIGA